METMRERFARIAGDLLDTDPRLAVVLADISADGFTGARRRHPDRVINVGIREQLVISVAGGLALAGMRPIAHTFASFLVERPWEQIKLDLVHQDVGAVLVSAGASYDIAAGGRTHQSPGDVALLSTLPDWTVHVPGHPDEAERLLRTAVTGDDGVYLRLSLESNLAPLAGPGDGWTLLRDGTAGAVVAVGPLADEVLRATEGMDVAVLYAATIRPFDGAALRAVLGRPDVVLVEPYLAGTSAAEASHALAGLPHRLLCLGVGRDELRHYGSREEHRVAHGLHAAALRERIGSFLAGGASAAGARAGSYAPMVVHGRERSQAT
jgi:transketolase